NNTTIIVPIVDSPGNNYSISFGDGITLSNQTGQVIHTYNTPGDYTVTISTGFSQIHFGSLLSSNLRPKSIEQWGDIAWSTMEGAFSGCSSLTINATDGPDLTNVTNLKSMFSGCTSLNQSINHWDVSNVTDMSGLFNMCSSFNQPLNNWDVSNVTNMSQIFSNCEAFNQPLNNWDMSAVTSMFGMFSGTTAFNHPLSNWNVSNVTNMHGVFFISGYNQPLDDWDVSSVTDMSAMFQMAEYNQPLNNWDVSSVTDMGNMFSDESMFNQPLSNWDVSNVINMNRMFEMSSINQDLSNWDFNNAVTYYSFAFSGLDTNNYDKLLARFAALGLQNKNIESTGLRYCDAVVRSYLINELDWNISGGLPGLNCTPNKIMGIVTFDQNNDGCNNEDPKFSNIRMTAANSPLTYSTFTSATGNFNLNVQQGTYVTQVSGLPPYFNTSPANSVTTFNGINDIETLDFCITSSLAINDLRVTLIPINEARPGFLAKYRAVVENRGTQTIEYGTLAITFNTALQSFLLSNPAVNT
ncbi:MAG: BspA family leucine-rich repeat surface protein, partial [Pedobacter sp.]